MLSGLGTAAALVGLVMVAGGSLGKAGLVLGGLAVSALACLPAIKEANENLRLLKKHGKADGGQFSPLKVWLDITLIGVGKVMHAVMICTLIGIPLYNMLGQVEQNMNYLVQQVELRQELEELKRQEDGRLIQQTAREYTKESAGK